MTARRLAITDVGEAAAHALRSIFDVLNGRTACRWELVGDPADADVVATSDFDTNSSRTHDARVRGKRVIAIVESTDARARVQTPYILMHPFRVMQVLSVLDEIADDLKHPELRIASNDGPNPWAFAESVRALSALSAPATWYRAQDRNGAEIIVTGNLHGCACEPQLFEQIRSGTTTLGALAPALVHSVPARYVRPPMTELLWHNAITASAALAPWLSARGSFRLVRWPDFGSIPSTRAQLQMVAALSRRACTPPELARATGASEPEIHRLLNALSLCGLLSVSEYTLADRSEAAAGTSVGGVIHALIGGLRRSLMRVS